MEEDKDKNNDNYRQNLFIIVFFLLLIGFALLLKFKDFHGLFNSEVVLTTQDAFRYARWAEEIKYGDYGEIDYLLNVPDYGVNPNPPPLLSLTAAWLSILFNTSLDFFFVILPPLLSIFFIMPLYFWIKTFISPPALYFVFPAGAVLGIFNMNYFMRTSMGYFDTDCLIFFFILLIISLMTYSLREKENIYKSYIYLLLAGLAFKLFMWWYYMPLMALFFAFSLISGLIAFRYPFRDILLKTFIFLLIILSPQYVSDLFSFAYGYILGAVLKQTDPIVSDVFSNILELKPANFDLFVSLTTDNHITFIIGLLGLLLLFVKDFKGMVMVLPFIAIGLLSFKIGVRYTIYLAPFLGMGSDIWHICYSIIFLKNI